MEEYTEWEKGKRGEGKENGERERTGRERERVKTYVSRWRIFSKHMRRERDSRMVDVSDKEPLIMDPI